MTERKRAREREREREIGIERGSGECLCVYVPSSGGQVKPKICSGSQPRSCSWKNKAIIM